VLQADGAGGGHNLDCVREFLEHGRDVGVRLGHCQLLRAPGVYGTAAVGSLVSRQNARGNASHVGQRLATPTDARLLSRQQQPGATSQTYM
jgi:hypothetical protein